MLFHHDPYHSDEELEALLDDTRRRWHDAGDRVCLAHEGMTMTIDDAGTTFAA